LFDNGLRFSALGKAPAIQIFGPKGAVKAFNEGLLPGTARRDVERTAMMVMQPLLQRVTAINLGLSLLA